MLPPVVDRRRLGSSRWVNLVEQSVRYTLLNTSRAEIFVAIKDKRATKLAKVDCRGI